MELAWRIVVDRSAIRRWKLAILLGVDGDNNLEMFDLESGDWLLTEAEANELARQEEATRRGREETAGALPKMNLLVCGRSSKMRASTRNDARRA